MRRAKSLRNGVHIANAVVWGPVYRTHLIPPARRSLRHDRFPRPLHRARDVARRRAATPRLDDVPPRARDLVVERVRGVQRALGLVAREPRLRVDARGVDDGELRVVPYKAMAGWYSKASGGVERRRGRGLNARDGRRETTAKVLKERRSPRQRGRMGTSVQNAPRIPARRRARGGARRPRLWPRARRARSPPPRTRRRRRDRRRRRARRARTATRARNRTTATADGDDDDDEGRSIRAKVGVEFKGVSWR